MLTGKKLRNLKSRQSIGEYISEHCSSDENFDEVVAEALKELGMGGEEFKIHFISVNFGDGNRKCDV